MILLASFEQSFALVSIVGILSVVMGLILRRIKQPYLVAYIIIGIVLGKHGIGLIENSVTIEFMAEVGIVFLFFFIGMEISLPKFLKRWKIAIGGTLFQILLSLLIVLLIGKVFGWNEVRSIVIGFTIALSSSAVIIKALESKDILHTKVGQNVLSILLTQDILIAPLLIITSFLGNDPQSFSQIIAKIIGGIVIIGILVYIYNKRYIRLPFHKTIERDHEMQVFMALFFCFAGALGATLFGLSPALGAFVGGMLMHSAKATEWIHDALNSFRVIFVAIFFISVGLQIDLNFIIENIGVISLVLIGVYLTNHFVNSFILKLFSCNWKEAILGGALLAQIGELSFLICSSAFHGGIIGDYGYKFAISMISLTLAISPFYILLTEKILHVHYGHNLVQLE